MVRVIPGEVEEGERRHHIMANHGDIQPALSMIPVKEQRKTPTNTGDDFLAIGPVLQIMQLNVEGLSAAKREVISSIAERQKIDAICLEETHVDADKTNRFSMAYSLHAKYV